MATYRDNTLSWPRTGSVVFLCLLLFHNLFVYAFVFLVFLLPCAFPSLRSVARACARVCSGFGSMLLTDASLCCDELMFPAVAACICFGSRRPELGFLLYGRDRVLT